jgi:hypothetical protein
MRSNCLAQPVSLDNNIQRQLLLRFLMSERAALIVELASNQVYSYHSFLGSTWFSSDGSVC